MDETYVKVNGRWRICTGPSTAGAALSILSLLRRNSKAAYRFLGKILKQREEVADPTIHQHG
ncbi:DDE-type integrase/transposase/recombinase [Klebsiella pneumoniae]|uniref:DDE-type integrase/transposase/recombinase n=1 Tax=Klebsiella pneumoniae TaxID=573 RepID=UPI003A5D2220